MRGPLFGALNIAHGAFQVPGVPLLGFQFVCSIFGDDPEPPPILDEYLLFDAAALLCAGPAPCPALSATAPPAAPAPSPPDPSPDAPPLHAGAWEEASGERAESLDTKALSKRASACGDQRPAGSSSAARGWC